MPASMIPPAMPGSQTAPGPQAAPRPPPAPPTAAVTLRAAYGAPDFVRRETDSELWHYDGMGCAAFFFL